MRENKKTNRGIPVWGLKPQVCDVVEVVLAMDACDKKDPQYKKLHTKAMRKVGEYNAAHYTGALNFSKARSVDQYSKFYAKQKKMDELEIQAQKDENKLKLENRKGK